MQPTLNTARSVAPAPSKAGSVSLEAATSRLLSYCRANNWAGYDPYDVLNSPIFRRVRLLDHRLPRLVFTQTFKRSPINLRGFLRVPKTQNPKAIALFLSALLKLEKLNFDYEKGDVEFMIERLVDLRSPGTDRWCWGYSFPWQTRTIVVPAGAPNLVCTCFVANALLDAYEHRQNPRCLDMAISAAEYIAEELYWTEGEVASFCYPTPSSRSQVHNANLLAAALLCRVHGLSRQDKFLLPALRAARYCAAKQHADGSWPYGEASTQGWIDNFHSGYNLCALEQISRSLGIAEFDEVTRRGFEFYRNHFFHQDGSVKYFHNQSYPIDTHCVAQSIITLLTFKTMEPNGLALAHSVFKWAVANLWDDRGFFYYRAMRLFTDRTSYMRWSQAWMLLAMVMLLDHGSLSSREAEVDGELVGVARRLDG